MSAENKVPAIRFKGFSGAWFFQTFDELINEQILLSPNDGNHGNIHPKSTDFVDYGIPFIMANNIKMGEIEIYNCSHIKKEQADTLQKGFAREGDVLLTHKGTVGEVAIVPENEFPYLMLTPQVTYYRILKIELLDNYFLATSFITRKFQTPLRLVSGGGTRAYIGITAQQKLGISIPPQPKEQTKIGNYFQQLDALIAQHQKKHDKLLNLKKALLEKMFPKQSASLPEIRFKGFGGEWEKKAFSEIVSRQTAMSKAADFPRVEYEDIVAGKGVLNKDILEKESSKAGIKFDSADILYGKLRPYLKNWLFSDFEGIAVGDFWVLRANETDSKFVYCLIQTPEFEKAANLSSGSKMPRSDWGLVSKTEFNTPEKIKEQGKIGNLFKQLDALLEQHQSQLKKLNNIKQACLEKMFV